MPRLTISVAVLALLFVVSFAWGLDQSRTRQQMENFLNNEYQLSFYNTLSQVRGLEVLLGKSLAVCGDSEDTRLFAEIFQQALAAQSNLTRLPVEGIAVARTSKFLNQVGDFSSSLLNQSAMGVPVSDEHWNTLRRLQNQAASLNNELHGIERQMERNGARFWEIDQLIRARRSAAAARPLDPAETEFRSINREMEAFPTLIYDGPFSDHLDRQQPRATGGEQVDQERAREIAMQAVDRREGVDYQTRITGTTRGQIPAVRVEVVGRGGAKDDRFTVDVARRGGEVVWFLNSRPPGAARLSVAEAKERAERYLAEHNLRNMQVTFSVRQGDTVTYNFAAVQDGVILYPDLLKVTVALDNGQVIGREAFGFVMNHHRRPNLEPTVSAEQARKKINERVKVSNVRLAVIPTDGGGELLTWEFRGEAAGNTYLVYVNANNGRQERILQLVDAPEGELTI
ncbi:MAG: germination protein YpeB [Desulforudis sp.]|nr:MAG: germination protein YpeB [Desulforudis sp.]